MPLDFLLRLMRDPHSPIARRLEAAKAAANPKSYKGQMREARAA
jgi:hypothetical protein